MNVFDPLLNYDSISNNYILPKVITIEITSNYLKFNSKYSFNLFFILKCGDLNI